MRPKQLGLCGPYRKQAERKRRRQGADAGHEHKIQSGGIRYLFDLFYWRPNRKAFQNLQNCVGWFLLRVCPDTLGRITKFSKHEPN
jgi:hypothetical protein